MLHASSCTGSSCVLADRLHLFRFVKADRTSDNATSHSCRHDMGNKTHWE